MKRLFGVIMTSCLVFSFVGCKKAEEKPPLPLGHPSIEKSMQHSTTETSRQERPVMLPKDTRETWTAVKIIAYDRLAKTEKDYIVRIGSALDLPNSKLTIQVVTFVPDFKMNDKYITTASNKSKNPAAQVLIQEFGRREWKGWLFAEHPGIHPFPHDQFDIRLIGGVSK